MKVPTRDIEAFLRNVDDKTAAVLLYGPDSGLVHERAEVLVAAVAGDAGDPFRVAELDAATIRDDPVRLAAEAGALSFDGKRRVVRIRDASDLIAEAMASALTDTAGGGLIVAEAGELGPRSSLRRLFEAADHAAAVPCYRDEAASLRQIIAEVLRQHHLQATTEAIDYLVDNLGDDRGITRQELEKLVTYVGDAGGKVQLDDARQCIGDNAALSLDDLVFAVGDGDFAQLDWATERNLQEGASPISVLRGVARHMLRIHVVAGAGANAERVMKSLRPPVHFHYAPRLHAQVRRWSTDQIGQALVKLTLAEDDCKRKGAPAEAICRRALLEIAGMQRQARRP